MEKELILSRAKSAAISRDFPLAIKLYKSLLKDNPSDMEVLNQLGSNYVKAGDDEKALLYYEQILTFNPHDVDAMNSMGAIYRRLKRYDDSINILQRALDEDKNTENVNYNLGFTYKEMGSFDDAIDAFTSVIDENPDDVLAHNHLGSIYYQKKDYQKSILCFKTGLQVDPNHPILQYNLAKCYEEVHQYVDAIKCFESALKARPGWTEALRDFSELLIRCQKTEDARNIVKRTIDLNPNDAKLYMLLGEIFLSEYDYDSAIDTLKQADSIEANNVRILTGLAEAFEKGEHPEEAMEIINKAMQIEPVSKDVEKQYVHTCLSAEEYDEAYTHVESLYKDNGENDAKVLDLYGQYYICVGDDENAKKYFDKIPSVDPEYKLYLLEAANRYSQIGKIREAEDLAKKYISKVPTDAFAYNSLGKIYEKQGDSKAAAKSFEEGVRVSNNNVYAKNKLINYKEINLEKNSTVSDFETPAKPAKDDFDLSQTLENLKDSIDDEEDVFDFSNMLDTSFGDINDIDPLAHDNPVIESEKYLDQPDPNLDAVYDKYPPLPKNPGAPAPHYPNSSPANNASEYIQPEPKPVASDYDDNKGKYAMEDFEKKAEETLQNLDEKAAEYEKNLQDKFDEQAKQLEEKAKNLMNQVGEASEGAAAVEDDHVVDELKENIADAFEEKIAEVLEEVDAEDASEDDFDTDEDEYIEVENNSDDADNDKKEFDFEESDSIIEDVSESGEPEMIDDEIEQNDDACFADVEDLFDSEVDEENQTVATDSTDDEFGSVDNLFGEVGAGEEINTGADIDNETETEDAAFGSVDDLFDETEVESETEIEETSFGSVDDLFGEAEAEVESEPEVAAETEIEDASFGSVDDLFAGNESETEVESEIKAETEDDADFGSVDDLFNEEEPAEVLESSENENVEEAVEVEELEELLDELTDEEIQANVINEDAPFEDIISAAAEVANDVALAEKVDLSAPKDSFDFLDPLATVRKYLPNIERILQDTDYAHAHTTELELFIKMKQFCEFLPTSELDKYRNSKIRMLLDYLIARFSGKPGLLVTAESLIKAGFLGEGVLEQIYENEVTMSYEEQVRTVLEYMKKLTEGLTSRRTADALCAEADKVLEELELRKL